MWGLFWEPKKGKVRPFTDYRTIQRGKNRGRVEISTPNGRPKRVIVDQEAVRRWPKKKEGG
jgi:hypothetical protein